MRQKEKLFMILMPVLSIICAFLVGGILILAIGKNPFVAYGHLFSGAFGSPQKLAQTLTIACPLFFTSLCAAYAYKCGVLNLGGEGQFIMGAVTSIFVCNQLGVRGIGGIIISLFLGALAGAIWGAIPGILKIARGLNEMIVSIMLNYVATLFMGYIYTNLLREGSTPQTAAIDDSLKLFRLSDDFRVHIGVIIGIVVAIILAYVMFQTSFGFKIRAVGMNPTASRVNGFAVNRLILLSFIVSGAIAGLGGSVELHGKQYRLLNGFGNGFGFDGVAIALIAQKNPIGAIVVAFFFGVLRKGSSSLQTGMNIPPAVVDIIQALVIIFAVAGSVLMRMPQIQQFFARRKAKKEVQVA